MVQSKNVRNTIFVAMFCLLLASLVWYWTENKIQFYLSGSKNKVEKIGQIKNVNYDALVNFSGQLVWQPLDQGDFIFDGNSLQTDKNSSTEIILDDGQQLTIGTNSLVRFIKEDGGISLQLVEGQIELKGDPKLASPESSLKFFLKTPSGKVNTKSTHLKVEKKSEGFKYEIVSGKPQLLDSEKPLISTKVSIETKTKEVKNELPATNLIAPPQNPVVETNLPADPVAVAKPVNSPAGQQNSALVQQKFEPVEKPVENLPPQAPKVVRDPANEKRKTVKLPPKIPLTAPKIKRVDIKVVE